MIKGLYVTVKPKSEQLQKYIAYYYFDISEEKDYVKSFIFYPHVKNALTIYKNASVNVIGNKTTVFPNSESDYLLIYQGIVKQPIYANIKAPYNKIGVAFQPLGISYFIKNALGEIIAEKASKYNFKEFSTIHSVLDLAYKTNDIDEKVALLDAFFTKEFKDFHEERVIKAIDEMLNGNFSVQDISEKLQISRKTLLRLFKKHLLCSPKDYINIIKFRKALTQYQEATKKPQLTELAYKHDYYDQSDFIKQFKKITGFNPKKFLGSLTHFGSEDTFWTIMK